MTKVEDLYRRCLETVATLENARMRQVMGRPTREDNQIQPEDHTLEALRRMGEATLDDLTRKTKLQRKVVHAHLMRLSRRGLVISDHCGSAHTPRIWLAKG